jgi:two-component system cell cycle sensor histidine kinase/response regulator CckA
MAPTLHGTETILLAEDHDSIREMVRQSLVNYGYRVLSAEAGEQVLPMCDQEVPDLAILGLVMPKLGGPATAIKLHERFPYLHVLFTSGYSEYSSAALSQVPASPYLQKPYSPWRLAGCFREILGPSPTPELFNTSSSEQGYALDV